MKTPPDATGPQSRLCRMFTRSKSRRSKMTVDARQFDEAQQRIAALTVNLTKVFPPITVVGLLRARLSMGPTRRCLLLQSLLGVKRTCRFALHMSAFDPKRTWEDLSRHGFGYDARP